MHQFNESLFKIVISYVTF